MRSKTAAKLHEMLLKSSKAELIEIIMSAFKSKKAAELHEMLLKSSKAELIEIIMSAFKLTSATFPWIELVRKEKLITLERKLEENRVKGEDLRKRLNLLSKADAEFLELMLDIRKNNDEYMKLLNKSIKLEKKIYG